MMGVIDHPDKGYDGKGTLRVTSEFFHLASLFTGQSGSQVTASGSSGLVPALFPTFVTRCHDGP